MFLEFASIFKKHNQMKGKEKKNFVFRNNKLVIFLVFIIIIIFLIYISLFHNIYLSIQFILLIWIPVRKEDTQG